MPYPYEFLADDFSKEWPYQYAFFPINFLESFLSMAYSI